MMPPNVLQLQLLATKYHAPADPQVFVPRPALREKLDAGLKSGHVLVGAPAGYGKSTLLGDWFRRGEFHIADRVWLSLELEDNDPALFWAYVISAFQDPDKPTGELALALLHAPHAVPLQTILASLINDIVEQSVHRVLILDDVHVIKEEEIHSGLSFLLDRLPDSVRLVLGTRSEPDIQLARKRASGRLTEIQLGDMRFTKQQSRHYLEQFLAAFPSGTNSDGGQNALELLEQVSERTEGWIAGLQMAAHTMRLSAAAGRKLSGLSGTVRQVYDFMLEEVLQTQPEEIRDFLLRTSILPYLNGSLCAEVVDDAKARALLERLHRSNLFLISLDDAGDRYRYHHLFAEVLQSKLEQEQPVLVPALHLRAGRWFQRKGEMGLAIRHALLANDTDLSAELAELYWRETDRKYQPVRWLEKAERLPDDAFAKRPVLNLGMGWALLDTGQIDRGAAFVEKAAGLLGSGESLVVSDQDTFDMLPALIAAARSYIAQATGDFETTAEQAQRTLDLLPDHEQSYRGIPLVILGMADIKRGDLNAAFERFTQASEQFEPAGDTLYHHAALSMRGTIRRLQGYLDESRVLYQDTRALIERKLGPHAPRLNMIRLGLAELLLDEGRVDQAETVLEQVDGSTVQDGERSLQQRWYSISAGIEQYRGLWESALDQLADAESSEAHSRIPEAVGFQERKALVLLQQGHSRKALAVLSGIDREADIHVLPKYADEAARRVLITTLLVDRVETSQAPAAGTPDIDWGLLGEMCFSASERAREQGRRTDEAQWLILHAVCGLLQPGEDDTAEKERAKNKQALQAALSILAQSNQVRLCREWAIVLEPVRGAIAKREEAFFRMVQSSMDTVISASVDGGVDNLSPREAEILGLVSDGLKNQQIADALFISLATVKRHIANIYSKMGVSSRTEAIREAVRRGWMT